MSKSLHRIALEHRLQDLIGAVINIDDLSDAEIERMIAHYQAADAYGTLEPFDVQVSADVTVPGWLVLTVVLIAFACFIGALVFAM